MKYYFSFLVICAFSCSKVENIDPPPCIEKEEIQDSTSKVIGNPFFPNPHGEAFCTKVNQLTWFEPYIGEYEKTFFYLRLIGLDSNKIASDEFVIYNIPLNIGCYKIEANSVDPNTKLVEAYYRNIDYDIIIDEFILDTSAINKISVSAIDTTSKTITGYFAVSFVFKNDRPKRNPFNPYRMRFFNGYFKGKYE
ncbi:MAG: hypothetical protein IPQ10_03735 [Saprospiraceae bacterium]|jgi:hypothetical protein|nr:hypothetical protein [Saprospiraceae bacterium]MBX7162367.1 hypothetical protein [Saprospiraceae bacterium]